MKLSPRSGALFGDAAFALTEADMAPLQAFFDANPGYHLAVGGQPPRADEAAQEFRDLPPPHMSYSARWLIGFTDAQGELIGMASVLSDFLAPAVWHLGLFIVATPLHGSGTAARLYREMEAWMKAHGAAWVRLGVVLGNRRAEAFWEKSGYAELRRRHGVEIGERRNTLRVMAKPLTGGRLDEYLQLVERDRPESTSA